jgi:P-type Ca2+ transporter type 2C
MPEVAVRLRPQAHDDIPPQSHRLHRLHKRGARNRARSLRDGHGRRGWGAVDEVRLLAVAEAMASDGRRVLAVACRRWDELPRDCDAENLEQDLTLLGLVGLVDPPRPEAKQAVAICKSAGITPVMITGDHPATARAIAAELQPH